MFKFCGYILMIYFNNKCLVYYSGLILKTIFVAKICVLRLRLWFKIRYMAED